MSIQGLVERLRHTRVDALTPIYSLLNEAADALEALAGERRHLEEKVSQYFNANDKLLEAQETIAALRAENEMYQRGYAELEQAQTIATLRAESAAHKANAENCYEEWKALRAENEALTRENETLLADENLAQAYIDNRELRAENERLRQDNAQNGRHLTATIESCKQANAENERLREALEEIISYGDGCGSDRVLCHGCNGRYDVARSALANIRENAK